MAVYTNPFEKQNTPASRLREKLAAYSTSLEEDEKEAYLAEKSLRFAASYGTGSQSLSSLCKNILK